MVSDAPFQRRTSESGLVKLDDEAVDIGGIPDSAKVADYAKQVKDMDEAAKACEEAAQGEKTEKGHVQYGKGLMNEFMEASNQYLKDIKQRGGIGNPATHSDVYYDRKIYLLQECSGQPGQGEGKGQWGKFKDWWVQEIARVNAICQKTWCTGHAYKCGNSTCYWYHQPKSPCASGNEGKAVYDQLIEAGKKRDATQKDFEFCDEKAKALKEKCTPVKDAIVKKRLTQKCEAVNSEFTMADAETKGDVNCDNLVWKSETGGNINQIVQMQNMGRDDNFKPTP